MRIALMFALIAGAFLFAPSTSQASPSALSAKAQNASAALAQEVGYRRRYYRPSYRPYYGYYRRPYYGYYRRPYYGYYRRPYYGYYRPYYGYYRPYYRPRVGVYFSF